MAETEAPLLKEMFNAARYREVAKLVAEIEPRFEKAKFLRSALAGLEELSLMQRLRRMTTCLHEALPMAYREQVDVLRQLAPKIETGFVTLFLPDFVGQYGGQDTAFSLEALTFFTPFGSSEFAIREYLRSDLLGTLKVMERWSREPNEHVRRLASEGCRPRLPWALKIPRLGQEPELVRSILQNLCADSSLYVRKSVANHLNDLSTLHPEWVMDLLESWPRKKTETAWITRQALRTLIKRGHPRALKLIGVSATTAIRIESFTVSPLSIKLGERFTLSTTIRSQAASEQRLVIDYLIHYVKKNGSTAPKVFKWKELTLAPNEAITVTKQQLVKNFTTRAHHPGNHRVELQVNGQIVGSASFVLKT
jgi:3-methyladenine DNA glycosylase AlkC